jgi:5-hydroxyisourate hydrolase-like protein (transthyretin family)
MLAVFVSGLALVGPALAKKPTSSATSKVTIAASPTTVVFGSQSTFTGQVTGKKAAGVSVELQSQSGTSTFTTVTTTTADATGHYTLKATPDKNTTYRVIAKTAPQATSSTVAVKVLVRVTLGVSTKTPKAGSRVRFSGLVLPAYNGKSVQIQRKTATGWKTVAQAKLAATTTMGGVTRSKYAKRLRISKNGTYRVFFNPADGLREPNHSGTKTLRVH